MLDTIAYLRVSSPRQATPDKVSLEDQRAELTTLARSLGRELRDEGVFVDPGVSGGTAARPAFQAMLAYCEHHPRPTKDGVILVYRDDRWGRFEDPDEAAHYAYRVRLLGWEVHFAVMGSQDDTVSPILRAIGRVAAREERRKISTRAKAGARGALERGFWTTRAPFGLARVAVDRATGAERPLCASQQKGGSEQTKLVLGDPREADAVRWLFASYATGTVSCSELTIQLASRFGFRWADSTVPRVLRNPIYVGDIAVGPKREILVVGAFPALVERDVFDRVQVLLNRNRKETSPVRYTYSLSGLIACGTCGQMMVGGAGGMVWKGKRFPVYKDGAIRRQIPCPGPRLTVAHQMLERLVVGAIADVIQQHDLGSRLAQEFDRILRGGTASVAETQAGLRTAIRAAEAKRDRLVDLVASGTLLQAEADRQLTLVRADLARLQGELERSRFTDRRIARMVSDRDRLVAVARDFRAHAARVHGAELRELVRPWIASGVIDKHTRVLTLKIRRFPELIAGASSDTLPPSPRRSRGGRPPGGAPERNRAVPG